MIYRSVGRSGLKVSSVALGSWMTNLRGTEAMDTACQTVRLAFERGINFFDCADAYSGGEAEKFLGECLSEYPRSKLVVSSKVFFPVGDGVNEHGLSRKHIFEQVEKSLRNMRVEYLDMYFCHRFDPDTPVEETLRAMDDLVHQGKILYYGVSEWSPAQINQALGIIRAMSLYPITVIQPQYNMIDRYIEDEIFDICKDNGIGIVPFSPLAQGLLTGKYRKGEPVPAGSRATYQADKQINKLLTDNNLEIVEKLQKVADELGIKLPVMALAWTLRDPVISSVICGASKASQLESNLEAVEVSLPKEAIDEIERILNYHPFHRKIG